MRLRVLVALVAAVVTPLAGGSPSVVGGYPVNVRNAPWSAYVHVDLGGGNEGVCSGSILDATHVLTAAHCVFEEDGARLPARALSVSVGVSNVASPLPTDHLQARVVASLRVHPGYRPSDHSGVDDVAVLALQSPLTLGTPTARAIALPRGNFRPPDGASVTLAGYGRTDVNRADDGVLNGMTATFFAGSRCLELPEVRANAIFACGFSGLNAPCFGDSGSALVTRGRAVEVGVTHSSECARNLTAIFVNLTAPEILRFVEGDDHPPMAPRLLELPTVAPSTTMQVGETVRCLPGLWTGRPSVRFVFLAGTDVLRTGASTYRLGIGDGGRFISCVVLATTAGGTSSAATVPTTPVERPPDLFVDGASARRGTTVDLHVTLSDWLQPVGRLTICARPRQPVGSPVCRHVIAPVEANPSLEIEVPIRATAPVGRTLVAVSARGTDGRAADADAVVSVGA
jgi:hypothetical protein